MPLFEIAWPGLVLGFLGSLHCIGMCGPIALSLPGQSGPIGSVAAGRVLYNAGRTITYGVLGAVAGLIGAVVNFADVQQVLSLTAGTLILLVVLTPRKWLYGLFSKLETGHVWGWVGRHTRGLFRSRSVWALFAIGLLNGFLPCGLVYVAMAGAVATGTIQAGTLFMLLFGLGTVPVMVATAMVGPMLGQKVRSTLKRAVPVMAGVLAVLLILRGLSLGIPYISPQLDSDKMEQGEAPCCH